MKNDQHMVKIWDIAVRSFHWLLLSAVAITYITEDDLLTVHAYAGYFIAGLISLRLIWGIIGSKHARFTSFVKSPRIVKQYLKEILQFKAKRHLGHNPAGGAMVLLLLLLLSISIISGIAAYATEASAGPLVGHIQILPLFIQNSLEDIHELFANLTLLLIFLHVAGVAFASLQHKENLVKSMINGYKKQ